MKWLLTMLIAVLLIVPSIVQAKGLTLWTGTGQLTEVNQERAVIYGRVGWSFADDNGGLEIAVGSTWYKADANPQAMSLLIIEHLPDLIDPNNPLPWIPGLLTAFINEDVVMAPYIGIEGTFQFVDEDAGMFGVIGGIKMKVTPQSISEWCVEGRYISPSGEFDGVKKGQIGLFWRYPF